MKLLFAALNRTQCQSCVSIILSLASPFARHQATPCATRRNTSISLSGMIVCVARETFSWLTSPQSPYYLCLFTFSWIFYLGIVFDDSRHTHTQWLPWCSPCSAAHGMDKTFIQNKRTEKKQVEGNLKREHFGQIGFVLNWLYDFVFIECVLRVDASINWFYIRNSCREFGGGEHTHTHRR